MSAQHLTSILVLASLLLTGCKTIEAPTASTKDTDSKPPAKEAKKDAAATHVVTNTGLKGKGQLEAVLESREMVQIKITPKTWSDFTIIEAATHGKRVKEGDVLIRCEDEKFKEQLAELEQDVPNAKLNIEIATAELENLKQSTPLRLEGAKRSQRQADEDYNYFETVGRAQREKSALFNVKSAEQRLENANEELAQLEKMYQADDLTEETEEIIVKRQRFAVEASKLSLESSKLYTERELKTSLPREHESLKNQKRDSELALTLAEQTLPKNLTKKINDLDKMKRDQKKSEKRLADLKHDQRFLDIKAPSDGMVYLGAAENGKWPNASSLAKRLIPGGKLTANEVIMTVVDPDDMVLKAIVPEGDLSKFKEGQKGEATPLAAPDTKLAVKLEELGYVPMPAGGFEATITFEKNKSLRLMPGMTCKVNLGGSEKSDAVVAPKDAVFKDGDETHVFVVTNEGDHERRKVKTGNSDERLTEILEGLSTGEKILLKRPN